MRVTRTRPNHALQRTRPSRRGCNQTPSWAGSLSGSCGERQRRSIFQPSVDAQRLRWVIAPPKKFPDPEGVASIGYWTHETTPSG